MAQKTTTELKAYKDANINTNHTNSITGAIHNLFLENLLDSLVNKVSDYSLLSIFDYDSTRIYYAGHGCFYGGELYRCNTDGTTGVWNASKWDIVTNNKRAGIEAITTLGTVITFSSALGMAGTDYALSPYVYNTAGDSMAFTISSRTENGFTITPAEDGTIEYTATLKK